MILPGVFEQPCRR